MEIELWQCKNAICNQQNANGWSDYCPHCGDPRGRAKARVEAVESPLEADFLEMIADSILPTPESEYRFHPTRLWRFDFAWIDEKLAVETEGGIWNGGRHTRGQGFIGDCTKYNAAAELGWVVLRYTSEHLKDAQSIIHTIGALLMSRKAAMKRRRKARIPRLKKASQRQNTQRQLKRKPRKLLQPSFERQPAKFDRWAIERKFPKRTA